MATDGAADVFESPTTWHSSVLIRSGRGEGTTISMILHHRSIDRALVLLTQLPTTAIITATLPATLRTTAFLFRPESKSQPSLASTDIKPGGRSDKLRGLRAIDVDGRGFNARGHGGTPRDVRAKTPSLLSELTDLVSLSCS